MRPPFPAPDATRVPFVAMLPVLDSNAMAPPFAALEAAVMSVPASSMLPPAWILTCPPLPSVPSAAINESGSVNMAPVVCMSTCPPFAPPDALIMLPTDKGSAGVNGVSSSLTMEKPEPWISTEPPFSPACPETSRVPTV